MEILVGYTGFVGSNICRQVRFDGLYNSKNITEAYGTKPDLCIYAGVRAEKFLANQQPEADLAHIEEAMENIRRIAPKRLVLISTIDVFTSPQGADESTLIEAEGLQPYGHHRYQLEEWVCEHICEHHIIRLPGLFGQGIKKNFIYDLMHPIPGLLNHQKFEELSVGEPLIAQSYRRQEGFYRCICPEAQQDDLKAAFARLNFSAPRFTDSRGVFQFYNLDYLYRHIQLALTQALPLLHLAVEPVGIDEVYSTVQGGTFENHLAAAPPRYDFITRYHSLFGGEKGYLFSKQQVLSDIAAFVTANSEVKLAKD